MTKDEIINICKKYNITNYTINDDMSINVNDDVILQDKQLTKFPLKFNTIMGFFDCGANDLTTLDGCPDYVDDDFYCDWNPIKTRYPIFQLSINGNIYSDCAWKF